MNGAERRSVMGDRPAASGPPWRTFGGEADFLAYSRRRRAHWDRVAREYDQGLKLGGYYHRRLAEIYRFIVPPDSKVLELGSARGDLLAACRPSRGVGLDFSAEMVKRARQRHQELEFFRADAHHFGLDFRPDFVLLSDLVNDLWDVQACLENLRRQVTPDARVVLNFYSRLWELPLSLAESLGLANPTLQQNWLTVDDVANLLEITGFEVVRSWHEIVWPLRTPGLDWLFNRILGRIWPLELFALTHLLVARPMPSPGELPPNPSVSVVVPVRNEAGNVRDAIERTPEMGRGTELIFVEGHSEDDSLETLKREIEGHPDRRCLLLEQPGEGKGDAVRYGFSRASGDILMILDGDLTVPPEDLRRFFAVLADGTGEFVNGVRLVYPIEGQAMRALNLVGNKLFSWAFTWLLGQIVKDTLCGTKAIWREDYERIVANRSYFGKFDPFGDFDLIFGAAKLNLKMVDLPVRYRRRTYGQTNIHRWKHGLLLLRMVAFAARRLRFV